MEQCHGEINVQHQPHVETPQVRDKLPKKRAKKGANDATKRRSKKRGPSKLMDMPLDVILEILSKLQPGDLLNVARSAKTFRGLLMKRSSITIWKAARQNVDELPECPTAMSEPAYAGLMFATNCSFCGKAGIQTIEWLMLVRCCKVCRENPDLFINLFSHDYDFSHSYPLLKEHMPSMANGKGIYVRVSEALPFVEQTRDWKSRGDVAAFLKAQSNKFSAWIEQAIPIKEWCVKRSDNRERELHELRDQRRAAVWAKLAELGLGEEEHQLKTCTSKQLKKLKGMNESTPLTNRVWDKMKDDVISLVQSSRHERLREARFAPYKAVIIDAFTPHLDAYARTRPLDDIFPSTLEFCMSARIRPMVEELVQNGANTIDVNHFTELIPKVCSDYKSCLDARMAELLPPFLRHAPRSPATALNSALVWFHCTNTDSSVSRLETTIAYPRVSRHRHLFSYHAPCMEPQTADDDLINAICDKYKFKTSTFSPELLKHISFDQHASFVAAEIVSLCGLDPAETSSADMDILDARIVCVPCQSAMSWRNSVSHALKHEREGAREWVVLNNADTKALKNIEALLKPSITEDILLCLRCREFDNAYFWAQPSKGMKRLEAHLKREHNVVLHTPELDVDYSCGTFNEPMSDAERARPVDRAKFNFTVSTAALVEAGW